MRWFARLGGIFALCGILGGCETTGDPTQGGLFGWSETKARERRSEREARVSGAEADVATEQAQSRNLESRNLGTEHQVTAAKSANERAQQKLHAQQLALLAKADRLEKESPTPATASRARAWRLRINTVAADPALSTADRSTRLRSMEAEIDAALEKAKK